MTRAALRLATALLALSACDTPPPDITPPPPVDQQLRQLIGQWGVVPIIPLPPQDAALVDVGQALVFDKILSGNRDIACATCHNPTTQGTDGLSLAIGTGGTGLGPTRVIGPGREFVP